MKNMESEGIHIGGSLLNTTDSQTSVRRRAYNSVIKAVHSETKEGRGPDITQWMIKEMQSGTLSPMENSAARRRPRAHHVLMHSMDSRYKNHAKMSNSR
mmetsp:Transcript_39019/g.51052  ORF Transcript_39019/g.51052 Transcript_39019/m.51052 type:complete len:99 (-) Transcript_39019:56-352(-)